MRYEKTIRLEKILFSFGVEGINWCNAKAYPRGKKATLPTVFLVSCPRNRHIFRYDQNRPPARREEGAYQNGYVTDEQRSRRSIFIATLWAAASWLFFRVARSSRIASDMVVARALKNSQLTCGERHAYFGDRTRGSPC
jgi:hypothetical protein